MVAYAFYETDTRIMQYTKALVERGDQVDVLALQSETQPPFEVLDGVNVYRIQSRRVNEKGSFAYLVRILGFLVRASFILAKRSLAKPYDVIHVHSVPDFLVFSALVPKLQGARVILDIHDILPEFYASKFGVSKNSITFKALVLVEKISIHFSNHVIIANHIWQRRLISRSVDSEKCSVFINYPDPAFFSPQPKRASNSRFLILYPGTLNKHQGVDVAVLSFAQVAGKMPGVEFHIHGEGPEKASLERLGAELGLDGRLFFHPFVPTREIARVMSEADLAVVPKRATSEFGNEAASTKIMEFMSLGVPLIVSRTKVDTFYHDSSQVQFVESENVQELAEAMLTLWRDAALRAKLVAGARRYLDHNSWQQKKLDYLQLVDDLCGSSSAPEKPLRNETPRTREASSPEAVESNLR